MRAEWLYGRDITHLPERDFRYKEEGWHRISRRALFDSMTVFEMWHFRSVTVWALKTKKNARYDCHDVESVELPGIEDLMPADLSEDE